MEIMRTMMDFEFDTKKVQNTHFHQDLEILYVLDGGLEIQIESEKLEFENYKIMNDYCSP